MLIELRDVEWKDRAPDTLGQMSLFAGHEGRNEMLRCDGLRVDRAEAVCEIREVESPRSKRLEVAERREVVEEATRSDRSNAPVMACDMATANPCVRSEMKKQISFAQRDVQPTTLNVMPLVEVDRDFESLQGSVFKCSCYGTQVGEG